MARHPTDDNEHPGKEKIKMDFASVVEHLPEIHELFVIYDRKYFASALQNCGTIVEWSNRMTLCAGICYLKHPIVIRLSRPLLSLRPFSDTVCTLLHEMIHAYLFLHGDRSGRDGHGPTFLAWRDRINADCGSHISVYHSFGEEVQFQRQHRWRCNGKCRSQAPFYGWVMRAVNRRPHSADWWHARHQRDCGGEFHKLESKKCLQCGVEDYHETDLCAECGFMQKNIIVVDEKGRQVIMRD